MNSIEFANLVVRITDIAMPITTLSIYILIITAEKNRNLSKFAAIPISLSLVWAGLWAWWPPLASIRFQSWPPGQGVAILAVDLALVSLLLFKPVQQYFKTANLKVFVWLGPWRIFYGFSLLVIGWYGGLPPAFFWSAGFGDVAVGLWSLSILARGEFVSHREVTLWNIFGLADLAHVLVLGAISLVPFFLLHPEFVPPTLLPIAGVPMLIAMHVYCLWVLTFQKQANVKPKLELQ